MSTTSGKGSKVPYRCSFRGKSQEQVRKLIAGQGVYICDECIHLCQEIIEEEMLEAPKAKPSATKLPDPRRIKEALDGYVISQERAKRVLAELGFIGAPEEIGGVRQTLDALAAWLKKRGMPLTDVGSEELAAFLSQRKKNGLIAASLRIATVHLKIFFRMGRQLARFVVFG